MDSWQGARPVLRSSCVVAVGLALAGCGTTLPSEPATRALYLDLRRVVETRQRTEWVADQAEVASLASTTLRSACAATADTRASLETWIDGELNARARAVGECPFWLHPEARFARVHGDARRFGAWAARAEPRGQAHRGDGSRVTWKHLFVGSVLTPVPSSG
jgi:hypothetical protein